MHNLLLFGTIGWAEILIIAFLILLLFGGKKIPELMKGLGKGVKSFKEGVKGIEDEANVVIDDDDDKDAKKKNVGKNDADESKKE
ncbi:MAG: twin-arginine translocase TatA/TatE family subunit [Bacteroidales bacterium]|jgi:sec-independent protein translocase protein TatA|nr:twin-arginine translocase TatA/TatE family subunit [Bacteroidales bacterium]MCI2122342.1 twin-arginine translocase TatA/TatE family subunit [Bacteroidales bacterium]MCI2146188.1 twin-arginine translocase TatA/TatE family subunit [Bacteroidales bacterium]